MYQIIWSESAVNQLKKIDRIVAKQIYQKVSMLRENPHRFVKKIMGSPYFRLRVGDYRVLVDIPKKELIVLVLKVGHRKKIYK